jgi:hypothetical protein
MSSQHSIVDAILAHIPTYHCCFIIYIINTISEIAVTNGREIKIKIKSRIKLMASDTIIHPSVGSSKSFKEPN